MKVFYRLSRSAASVWPVYSQTRSSLLLCPDGAAVGPCPRLRREGAKASTDRLVNIYSTLPQVKGFVTELITVNFCPFCGEAIEICRAK